MPRSIRFAKMQGIGNDFIAFERSWLEGLNPFTLAPTLCDRNFGIGADGLIIIGPSQNPECVFDFIMVNPDGTPDMCGNGLRCAALLAYRNGLIPLETNRFQVTTPSGVHSVETISISNNLLTAEVKVELGIPSLQPHDIPLYPSRLMPKGKSYELVLGDADITLTPVSTGSTHSVIFVDDLPENQTFLAISPQIENHPAFPERTSIMWSKKNHNNGFDIRIWERGAGETLGCGTGACAVAAAAIVNGYADFDQDIPVSSKGGTLKINWPAQNKPILMTGPATWVYEGLVRVD